MGIEMMTIVLHHSKAKGTDKLVLLGIANHHDEEGAWPSMATLAKYANAHVETVRRSIRVLEELGELVTEAGAGGSAKTRGNRRPNLYKIQVRCPAGCEGPMHHTARPHKSVAPQNRGVKKKPLMRKVDPTDLWPHKSVTPQKRLPNRGSTYRRTSEGDVGDTPSLSKKLLKKIPTRTRTREAGMRDVITDILKSKKVVTRGAICSSVIDALGDVDRTKVDVVLNELIKTGVASKDGFYYSLTKKAAIR